MTTLSAAYTLSRGTHATPEQGRCAMEWVSFLAGEPHSDAPACVSPALRAICIALNDGLAHGPRQRLRPYLARTIGTADDRRDPERGWLALDWLTRDFTPTWLARAGLERPAAELRALPALEDAASLDVALGRLRRARGLARDARHRAYSGPGGWVTGIVQSRAGREAAWHCAGEAAWAAARVALGEQGASAARAAALIRATAGDAAAVACRRERPDEVCGDSGLRPVMREAARPTLEELAAGALALLDAMLVAEPLTGFALAADVLVG